MESGRIGFQRILMSYPLTIVCCEGCESRFVLEPGAIVEDALLEVIRLLCLPCRDGEDQGEE